MLSDKSSKKLLLIAYYIETGIKELSDIIVQKEDNTTLRKIATKEYDSYSIVYKESFCHDELSFAVKNKL
jgi:hypothetical protein